MKPTSRAMREAEFRLVFSRRDALEPLELADRLLDPGARLLKRLGEEGGLVLLVGLVRNDGNGAAIPRGPGRLSAASKQTFLGCPTHARFDSIVFAEFFSKTGKATFGNPA